MADVLDRPEKETKPAPESGLEKLEKEEKKKRDERAKLANGPISGGKVSVKESGEDEVLTEEYEGYHHLVVKCTRGEQKAETGDKAYQITIHNKDTDEDEVYLFLIPAPVVELLGIDKPEPMTTQAYSDYVQKSGEKKAEKDRQKQGRPGLKPTPPIHTPTPKPTPLPAAAEQKF